MADEIRFTELPNADLPLVGEEIVALVQNGISKKVKVGEVGGKLTPEAFNNYFQDGLEQFTPNVTSHNFNYITITTDWNWTGLSMRQFPYTKVGSVTFGTPFRFGDYGSIFARMYALPTSSFVTVDNEYMNGWTSQVFNFGVLFEVNAPNLIEMGRIQYDNNFYKINAPNLLRIGELSTYSNCYVDFPSCEAVSYLGIWNPPAFFNLPNLKSTGDFYVYGYNLATLSLPNLEIATQLQVSGVGMNQLLLPSLEFTNNISINNCYNLQVIDLSGLKATIGNNVSFQNLALNQSSVDNILWQFANMNGTNNGCQFVFQNGQININGGSSATPSAYGLQAIQILNNRSVSVFTN